VGFRAIGPDALRSSDIRRFGWNARILADWCLFQRPCSNALEELETRLVGLPELASQKTAFGARPGYSPKSSFGMRER
jgi:hypothetical protein